MYIDTDTIMRVASAAEEVGCTPAYIYTLIKTKPDEKPLIEAVYIDEVAFIRRVDIPAIRHLLATSTKGKGGRPKKLKP